MAEDKIYMDFDPNDFVIRISPFLDQEGNWTGELLVGSCTTDENSVSDEDYVNLMQITHMVCASIPAMESDETVRSTLLKYAEDALEEQEEEKPKLRLVETDDNVIKVNFK